MRSLTLYILAAMLLVSCNSTYSVVAPRPSLTISGGEDFSYLTGQTFIINLTATQQGEAEVFSISVATISGKATYSLQGSALTGNGEWVKLPNSNSKLAVTPIAAGDLIIALQVKSSMGAMSDKKAYSTVVISSGELEASAHCESEIINPTKESRHPIQLTVSKPGFNGPFTVHASLVQGQGRLYAEDNIVTEADFILPASGIVEYCPDALGDHVVEFTVKGNNSSVKTKAYVEVFKEITVESLAKGCLTILGEGRYSTESTPITFSIRNNEEYNFEVEGWYDQRNNLLSADSIYTTKISLHSPSQITLNLKQRTVRISRGSWRDVEFRYLYKPTSTMKSVWDAQTSLSSDYRVSDPIVFTYEYYKYNTDFYSDHNSSGSPQLEHRIHNCKFEVGSNWLGYFWRQDEQLALYYNVANNPNYKINQQRSIESTTTLYILPAGTSIQQNWP